MYSYLFIIPVLFSPALVFTVLFNNKALHVFLPLEGDSIVFIYFLNIVFGL